MKKYQIVIDTNVFVAALRSQRGASYRLLQLIDSGQFEANISVPQILEYEDVAKRLIDENSPLTERDVDDIIDYICQVSNRQTVYYLWRPFLKDPKDDMLLELAIAAGCQFIVTYNKSDFEGVERFGIRLVTAREFLVEIGEVS
jgi:putative PIN family toxin of toxin-antitoxin system